jgi:hypothetical protein
VRLTRRREELAGNL